MVATDKDKLISDLKDQTSFRAGSSAPDNSLQEESEPLLRSKRRFKKARRLHTPDKPGLGRIVIPGTALLVLLYISLLAALNGFHQVWFFPAVIVGMVSILALVVFRLLQLQKERLLQNNAALAVRLEKLEDQSWEIRESEERYRSLAEAFGDLVVQRDLEGRILYANDAFLQVFGGKLDPNSPDGERYFHLDSVFDGNPVQHSLDTSKARDIQLETQNGMRWFSWLDLAIRDNESNRSVIISVARDITERKEYEHTLEDAKRRAESASQAKSRFIATVSHEIRTPLNGILGMSDLLMDTKLTPSQKTFVEAVETSGKSLLSLIEDLLDITKIEANRLDIIPVPTSIRTLLDELAELLANPAHAKNIGIASYTAPNVPEEVMVDHGRLRQVLLNIAGNAVKFTENGAVAISVTLASGKGVNKTAQLEFVVRDTGPGLSREDQKRIFKEFEQVDNGSNRSHNGAGLGLAISKRIVRKMGGIIKLESAPGKGSTFSFILDVPVVSKAGQAANISRNATASALLLADDSLETSVISRLIEDCGYRAYVCPSLEEARRAMANAMREGLSVDTVIVDYRLKLEPEQVIGMLRESAQNRVRLFTLVNPAQRAFVEGLIDKGYDGWLMRPVRAKSLQGVISGIADGACEQGPEQTEGPDNKGERTASLRILLVEDNRINQLLARTLMERSGHRVVVAENGQSAVDAFNRSIRQGNAFFDLILMDLHMPDMDGFEAIKIIRSIEDNGGRNPVPILVLSADEQDKIRQIAIETGANGFVSKPIDSAQLTKAVNEVARSGLIETSVCSA